MLRRNHHLALHQTPGGIFRVRHRLFDRHPVGIVQRAEDLLLGGLIKVFKDVDDVIGIKLADGFRHHLIGQRFDNLFADRLVDL